jgi:hypothetical protein
MKVALVHGKGDHDELGWAVDRGGKALNGSARAASWLRVGLQALAAGTDEWAQGHRAGGAHSDK